MNNICAFIVSLLAPFIVIRVAIHNMTRKEIVVKVGEAKFHHLHLGILLVFASSLLFLFTGVNLTSIVFLGLGLGFIMDEFVASVVVPHQEPLSTKLYLGSLKGTIVLFGALVFMVLAFYLALKSGLV